MGGGPDEIKPAVEPAPEISVEEAMAVRKATDKRRRGRASLIVPPPPAIGEASPTDSALNTPY